MRTVYIVALKASGPRKEPWIPVMDTFVKVGQEYEALKFDVFNDDEYQLINDESANGFIVHKDDLHILSSYVDLPGKTYLGHQYTIDALGIA